MNDSTKLQAEPTMRRQQGITGHCGTHLAIAQDKMRQNREHRATRGTLEPPDGDATETAPQIMGVAGQAPIPVTGRLVFQLKPDGQDERHHQFDKRLPIVQQTKVGGFILEIDGDSSVFAGLASVVSHGASSGQMVIAAEDPRMGRRLNNFNEIVKDVWASPLNSVECENYSG